MRGGTVASWEALSWHDEGGCIWTEVEEELDEDVESELGVTRELLVSETPDAEEDGEDGEAHQLNWLTSDGVNKCDGDPVTWNGTSNDENAVTGGKVVKLLVGSGSTSVVDSL